VWVEIYYLAPILILAIAALLATFWPHRAKPQQAQAVAEEISRQ
jgi:hypothetical protein